MKVVKRRRKAKRVPSGSRGNGENKRMRVFTVAVDSQRKRERKRNPGAENSSVGEEFELLPSWDLKME